jgi:ComF family protein
MTSWSPEGFDAPASANVEPKPSLARKARELGRVLSARALDLLYPSTCLSCRAAVSAPDTLCAKCWTQIRFIERPYCERLGTPFAQDLGPGLLSPEAMADPPVWNRARAVCAFDEGPARRLTYRFKYWDRMELAKAVGAWMARAGSELLETADLLVPVPLHHARLSTRRFNQAAELSKWVSRASGVPTDPELIERIKSTPPQVGLSKLQRSVNLQGAFRVPAAAAPRVAGARVVLVDDVLTTGATCNAAARALLRAGAANVDVLTFARVVLSG